MHCSVIANSITLYQFSNIFIIGANTIAVKHECQPAAHTKPLNPGYMVFGGFIPTLSTNGAGVETLNKPPDVTTKSAFFGSAELGSTEELSK